MIKYKAKYKKSGLSGFYLKILFSLTSLCLMFSCADFLKKEIEVEGIDENPKLVVSATLEDNLFCIYLGLSTPIVTQQTYHSSEVVKNAVVKLYEEDELLLEITEQDEYPQPHYDPNYLYLFPYTLREDIRVTPGKSYRLEVTLEGYPPVTSTVIAPQEPEIENAYIVTTPFVDKVFDLVERDYNRIAFAENLQMNYNYNQCSSFFQLNMTLTDDPSKKNYYLIEVFETALPDAKIYDLQMSQRQLIATTDRILIQDNPEVVANQWLNEPEKNTFAFGQMTLSDISFQGKKQGLNLLISECGLNYKDNYCDYFERNGYNPAWFYRTEYRLVAVVKHICRESYDFYRTLISQSGEDDLGFLSEPAIIISNIEGGYGCFSVASTKQITLLNYDVCRRSY